jgi:hypothetical protein
VHHPNFQFKAVRPNPVFVGVTLAWCWQFSAIKFTVNHMSKPASRWRRYRISLWLVAIHTVLILLLGLMSGSPWMNDQSPVMLLPVLLYAVDYPVHFLLGHFVATSQSAGYLTLVLFVGGVYWFLIGVILRALIGTARVDASNESAAERQNQAKSA